MGSKAGEAERIFNKTTTVNLHITLNAPSGVLTELSPDHSTIVHAQPWDRTALKHSQKPFVRTEVSL